MIEGLDTPQAILEWAVAVGPRPVEVHPDDGEVARFLAECVRVRQRLEFELPICERQAATTKGYHAARGAVNILKAIKHDAMKGGAE